jgi:hypothetical protein
MCDRACGPLDDGLAYINPAATMLATGFDATAFPEFGCCRPVNSAASIKAAVFSWYQMPGEAESGPTDRRERRIG